MYSVRKWIFKPKKSDTSLLARFFYADEDLNSVAAELDRFDGRKEPDRCSSWVTRLRSCQDKVLRVIEQIMMVTICEYHKASRDFRAKFPDDVLQDSLSGQLWFGAECLAAGSSILNREVESAYMRPLATKMTRHLEFLRSLLRDQCLRDITDYTPKIRKALIDFDRMFAEFELCYVSAMVTVKSVKEYDQIQDITVLFCDTTTRALKRKLVSQCDLDDCDPGLMFSIPRLAIVCGLLVFPVGPLNPDLDANEISDMFRPFHTLLFKIRQLLQTLSPNELLRLEFMLCDSDEANVPPSEDRDLQTLFSDANGGSRSDQYSNLLGLAKSGRTVTTMADIGTSCSSCRSSQTRRRKPSIGHAESWPTLNDVSNVNAGHHSIINIADIGYIDASDADDDDIKPKSLGDQISMSIINERTSKCNDARSKFKSSDDLIHRLFVCIAGVADQLQTNCAGDLRCVLKSVFLMSSREQDSEDAAEDDTLVIAEPTRGSTKSPGSTTRAVCGATGDGADSGPAWVPDGNVSQCAGCRNNFNLMRRKHHCRNCGLIFCSHCSDHYVFLPKLGGQKSQRVCSDCFNNAPPATTV